MSPNCINSRRALAFNHTANIDGAEFIGVSKMNWMVYPSSLEFTMIHTKSHRLYFVHRDAFQYWIVDSRVASTTPLTLQRWQWEHQQELDVRSTWLLFGAEMYPLGTGISIWRSQAPSANEFVNQIMSSPLINILSCGNWLQPIRQEIQLWGCLHNLKVPVTKQRVDGRVVIVYAKSIYLSVICDDHSNVSTRLCL